MTTVFPIPDIQSQLDTRRIAIDAVGIKGLRHPVVIHDHEQAAQASVATFSFTVNLPHDRKGTHMSRFVEILNRRERDISIENFPAMLREMVQKLEAESGHIEMNFPYFIKKKAPVTGTPSLIDYDVTLIGEICHGEIISTVKVVVPVTSLCPCSKKISERGAHNQRSHVTVTARLLEHVWIEEIVQMVEAQASSELFALLKRPDEKYVTEHAYDNPKFVEDMVRDVAASLNAEKRIAAYLVESENFESIHNHSAYALIESTR